ncbi:MAG: hypothetical protein Q7S09_00125 [bacterium]|nr:hypothetical protein [bacterium]
MLPTLFMLFVISGVTLIVLFTRKLPQARAVIVLKNAMSPAVPVGAVMNAAAAQAGNIFFRLLEKFLRRFKIIAMKSDNASTVWIHRIKERSKNLSLQYHDWRMQKHGLPKVSFESSLVSDIEEWFDGFFHRYFRRGVGYDRTTVRDDLEPREKVLVAAILADPKNVSAYRDLGLYYFEQGNLPDALSAFEAIRKIDPTNSEAADRLRHIKEVLGMPEEGTRNT